MLDKVKKFIFKDYFAELDSVIDKDGTNRCDIKFRLYDGKAYDLLSDIAVQNNIEIMNRQVGLKKRECRFFATDRSYFRSGIKLVTGQKKKVVREMFMICPHIQKNATVIFTDINKMNYLCSRVMVSEDGLILVFQEWITDSTGKHNGFGTVCQLFLEKPLGSVGRDC